MTNFSAGSTMYHEPTKRKCTIVQSSEILIEDHDHDPMVQVQFEGVSCTSFVHSSEIKEFLLG
jgi:hypothetical protein